MGRSEEFMVKLSVCHTCLYAAEYGVAEAATGDEELEDKIEAGLAKWNDWSLIDACGEECSPGFTWEACDICGRGGRDEHYISAYPVGPKAFQDIAAESYRWGDRSKGWKAIPGASSYRQ